MTTEPDTNHLHEPVSRVLVDVMRSVSHVPKGERNPDQGYRFRGVDATVNAVGPALRDWGVLVLPRVQSSEWASVRTSRDKPASACRLVVEYRFVGPAGDEISVTVAGEGWDHGDKAASKAMSVCFRIALLQALCLPTDEPRDPDHDTYERADPSDADSLRADIRTVAAEKGIALSDVAQDFYDRVKVEIRNAEPKLLSHYLGHLRTHGLTYSANGGGK